MVNRFLVRPGIAKGAHCIRSLSVPLRALLFVAALVLAALAQPVAGNAVGDSANQPVSGSLEELAGSIEHEHPLAAFELSKRLWEAGRKDEAVFFFYLVQLRFRSRLLANPNGDPTGGRALFDALMSAMGPPINTHLAIFRHCSRPSTASSPGMTAMPTITHRPGRARRQRPD